MVNVEHEGLAPFVAGSDRQKMQLPQGGGSKTIVVVGGARGEVGLKKFRHLKSSFGGN